MGDLKRRLKGRLKGEGLRGGLRWRTFGLRWGTLRGGSRKSLRDGLKGGLRGDLPPQNPFPLASPASNFFSLYIAPSPEASGKSLYMWRRAPPSLPPCFTFFLPLHRPLSEGLGQVSQRSNPRPPLQKLAPLIPPSYLPSLKPLPRNAFYPPPTLLPCFLLPLHCPLSGGLHSPSPEASGKSLYMWPGLASLAPTTYTKTCPAYATPFVPTLLKTASPERLLRPPLASSPASNFFSL